MAQREEAQQPSPTHSTVALGRHPLHPALADFPIALLTAALVTDILFWWTSSPPWADFSFWLILAGFVTGLVAFLTGLVDFLTVARARQVAAGWVHFFVTDLALFLTTFNFAARLDDRQGAVLFAGVGLSIAVTLLLLVGGYAGGRLVFAHRIGVYGNDGAYEGPGSQRGANETEGAK